MESNQLHLSLAGTINYIRKISPHQRLRQKRVHHLYYKGGKWLDLYCYDNDCMMLTIVG